MKILTKLPSLKTAVCTLNMNGWNMNFSIGWPMSTGELRMYLQKIAEGADYCWWFDLIIEID